MDLWEQCDNRRRNGPVNFPAGNTEPGKKDRMGPKISRCSG